MKRIFKAAALLLALCFTLAGCGVNKEKYESMSTSAYIDLFSNSNPHGLAYRLGTPVRLAVTGKYNDGDVSGEVTYRRTLAEGETAEAKAEEYRALVEDFNRLDGAFGSSGGRLKQADFDKGFRLIYFDRWEGKAENDASYLYTTLRFGSLKNLGSNYKLTPLADLSISNASKYNSFRDEKGIIVSLAAIEKKEDLFVIELTLTSNSLRSELEFVTYGRALAAHATLGKIDSIEGKSVRVDHGTETGSNTLSILYSGKSYGALTAVLLIVAAVLAVGLVAAVAIRLTVKRK